MASFFEQGFLACPGVLSEEHVAALKADTDRYMAEAGFSAQQGADDNFEEAITPRLTQPTLAPVLGGLPSFRPVVEIDYGPLGHDYSRAEDDERELSEEELETINGLLAERLQARQQRLDPCPRHPSPSMRHPRDSF